MSLTTLDEDLAVHQKLSDEPNDVGGLSAQELKAKFDQAGLAIQSYLNETHLPQVEQALEDTLQAAKGYTDGKLVAMGAGDMTSAIYDTKGRRADLYQYAHDEAVNVLGSAARFGYVAMGRAKGSTASSKATCVTLLDPIDPRGLWNEDLECFVIPQGGQAFGLTAHLKWGRQTFANCTLRLLVNGEVVQEVKGPDSSTETYIYQTVLMGAPVQGGDHVQLEVAAYTPIGYQAEVIVLYLRGEILL